jgi:hypothetical protein
LNHIVRLCGCLELSSIYILDQECLFIYDYVVLAKSSSSFWGIPSQVENLRCSPKALFGSGINI